MVKKLLKQDFSALLRTLLPMWLVLLGIALLTRFVYLFEADNTTFRIIGGSSIVALVVAVIVCLVMTEVLCIVRFYRNLYSSEGYLTFTLPATHAEHLWSKLISSMAVTFASVLVTLLAGVAATSFDMLAELLRLLAYFWKNVYREIGADLPVYVAEYLLLLITAISAFYLLLYTCITIGQMAKKNRILAAFGVYFAYYMIMQILSVILMILLTVFMATDSFLVLSEWIENHPWSTVHIALIAAFVFSVVWNGFCWLLTHRLMKKKLNLE